MLRLIKPVALHKNLEGTPEYSGIWTDLLFNLTFVLVIGGLAENLDKHLNPNGLLEFGLYMLPVWWAWVGDSFYNARFFANDSLRLLLIGIKMALASIMAIAIQRHSGHYEAYFLMAYAGLRCLLIVDYARSWQHLPEARPLIIRYIVGFTVAILLWVIAIWASWNAIENKFLFWVPAACIDLLTPLTGGRLRSQMQPNLKMLINRFETFALFILGELLSGIIQAIGQRPSIQGSFLSGSLSFLFILGFGWLFFEVKGTEHLTPPTSEKPHFIYLKWLFSHLSLILGLTTSGIVLKHLVSVGDATRATSFEQLLLSLSFFLILLCMDNLTTQGPRFQWNRQVLTLWGVKCLVFSGVIGLGIVSIPMNAVIPMTILMLCAFIVCQVAKKEAKKRVGLKMAEAEILLKTVNNK